MHTGKNIQLLRQNLNMTQQDLAECLGLSRSAISRIEKKNFIDTKILDMICTKFNLPITTLLEDNLNISNDTYSSYEIKTVRDINKNSIQMYRKLSDRHKSFSRAIGLEIHKEIIDCEIKAIERFSKDLINDFITFSNELNNSNELNKDLENNYLNFLNNYTKEWIANNKTM